MGKVSPLSPVVDTPIDKYALANFQILKQCFKIGKLASAYKHAGRHDRDRWSFFGKVGGAKSDIG